MLESLRTQWKHLKEGEPGRRFCYLYDRRQKKGDDQSALRRYAPIALGILLVVGGAAIGWLPGPGGFVAVLGLGILATRFRFLARALDWTELRLIGLWRHAWTRRSTPGRVVVVAVALVIVGGVAYAASRILLS